MIFLSEILWLASSDMHKRFIVSCGVSGSPGRMNWTIRIIKSLLGKDFVGPRQRVGVGFAAESESES
jgi:hypothetical protein